MFWTIVFALIFVYVGLPILAILIGSVLSIVVAVISEIIDVIEKYVHKKN